MADNSNRSDVLAELRQKGLKGADAVLAAESAFASIPWAAAMQRLAEWRTGRSWKERVLDFAAAVGERILFPRAARQQWVQSRQFASSHGVSAGQAASKPVIAMAKGGVIVTNGPQQILVGDNPSGREIVTVTPLGDSSSAADPTPPMAQPVPFTGREVTEDFWPVIDDFSQWDSEKLPGNGRSASMPAAAGSFGFSGTPRLAASAASMPNAPSIVPDVVSTLARPKRRKSRRAVKPIPPKTAGGAHVTLTEEEARRIFGDKLDAALGDTKPDHGKTLPGQSAAMPPMTAAAASMPPVPPGRPPSVGAAGAAPEPPERPNWFTGGPKVEFAEATGRMKQEAESRVPESPPVAPAPAPIPAGESSSVGEAASMPQQPAAVPPPVPPWMRQGPRVEFETDEAGDDDKPVGQQAAMPTHAAASSMPTRRDSGLMDDLIDFIWPYLPNFARRGITMFRQAKAAHGLYRRMQGRRAVRASGSAAMAMSPGAAASMPPSNGHPLMPSGGSGSGGGFVSPPPSSAPPPGGFPAGGPGRRRRGRSAGWWGSFRRAPFRRMSRMMSVASARNPALLGAAGGAIAGGVLPVASLGIRSLVAASNAPDTINGWQTRGDVARSAYRAGSAVAGTAVGAAAGIGLGAAGGAVGGPVGAAIGAGTGMLLGATLEKLTNWFLKLSEAVLKFSDRMNEGNRELGNYNGRIAGAMAQLEQSRFANKYAMGQATEGSGAELARSIAEMERSLQPLYQDIGTITNVVSTKVAQAVGWIGAMYELLKKRFPALEEYLKEINENGKKANDGPIKPFGKEFADQLFDAQAGKKRREREEKQRQPINPLWE